MNVLYTIGHSSHPIEVFIGFLQQHGISALADVRSFPGSRLYPQFAQAALKSSLQHAGIIYVYLGRELGAKRENPACLLQGKISFELLAGTPLFLQGLERLRQGMEKHCICLMCAEQNPLDCHRSILIARRMAESGTPIRHIHADGHLEAHEALESRLLERYGLEVHDLFRSRGEVLAEAYRRHAGQMVAHSVRK